MAQTRIDTGAVISLAGSLNAPIGRIAASQGHVLAALAMDPSILMRANIRGRIGTNAADLARVAGRIERLRVMTVSGARQYAWTDGRIRAQLEPPVPALVRPPTVQLAYALSGGFGAFVSTLISTNPSLRNELIKRLSRMALTIPLKYEAAILKQLAAIELMAGRYSGLASRMGLKYLAGASNLLQLAKSFKWAGYAAQVGFAVYDGVTEFFTSRGLGQSMERSISNGVVVGGVPLAAGIGVGMAIGSCLAPGPGTIVGGIVGGGVGWVTSWAVKSEWVGGGRSYKDRIGDSVEAIGQYTRGDYVNAQRSSATAIRGFGRSPLMYVTAAVAGPAMPLAPLFMAANP